MQPDPTTGVSRPSTMRAAVTNRHRHFTGLDGRSARARRLKDLVEAFTADLGRLGGPTTAEHAAILTASVLCLQLEQAQAATLKGEPINASDLLKLTEAVSIALENLPPPGP